MTIFFNKADLQGDGANSRILNAQYRVLQDMRQTGADAHNAMLQYTNVARTPAEAYREFDSQTKIEQVPAGEFAALTRVLSKAKPVNIGRKLYEHRKASDMDLGQSSMTGQIGIKDDKVDYGYGGTIVPVHDKGFGIDYRDYESMRADGYDVLVDYSREAQRGLMKTVNNYMWDGDASLEFKGVTWLGLKADSRVAVTTTALDLSASASTAENIRAEVARLRDVLYITNNCTNPLDVVVSREIASNWERPFSTADGSFGTIGDYITKLRGIKEVYEDDKLTGNEIAMYWNDQMGFHAVSGMALSTYAIPRQFHNSPFSYIKWMATGFLPKQDFSGRKCALYATTA